MTMNLSLHPMKDISWVQNRAQKKTTKMTVFWCRFHGKVVLLVCCGMFLFDVFFGVICDDVCAFFVV